MTMSSTKPDIMPQLAGISPNKNGKVTTMTFEEKRAALEAQKAALEAEEAEMKLAEAKEAEAARAVTTAKIDSLFSTAQQYEQWAKDELAKSLKERDPVQAETFLSYAKERKAEARKLQAELGLEPTQELAVDLAAPETDKHPWWIPFAQIGGLCLMIWLCVKGFWDTQRKIAEHNAVVEPFAQVRAHDLDAVQKLFFEKMTVGTDLLVMLGIIGIISPVIFVYIVPIIKSKRDFLNEFNNDLTSWQRGLITTIIIAAVLLYLGLSHSARM